MVAQPKLCGVGQLTSGKPGWQQCNWIRSYRNDCFQQDTSGFERGSGGGLCLGGPANACGHSHPSRDLCELLLHVRQKVA
jgi:hypothetical protein